MFRFIFLFCLVALASAQTSVQRCTVNATPLPVSVNVGGCRQSPCLLQRNREVQISWTFRTPVRTAAMFTTASATVWVGNTLRTVRPNLGVYATACNFSSPRCPVAANQQITYNLRLPLDANFPVGSTGVIQLTIIETGVATLSCIGIPYRVV